MKNLVPNIFDEALSKFLKTPYDSIKKRTLGEIIELIEKNSIPYSEKQALMTYILYIACSKGFRTKFLWRLTKLLVFHKS